MKDGPRNRPGNHLQKTAVILLTLLLVMMYVGCGEDSKDLIVTPGVRAKMVMADDIPVAHTPGCGYEEFPPPVLADCTEPLVPEAPDLRGLWEAYEGMVGHIERVEQCGNRVVITGHGPLAPLGVIHDMRADGTLENGVNDVSEILCWPIQVAAEFVDGKLALRPNGGPVIVTRELDGDEMIWVYAIFTSRLRRIDTIP